MPAHIRLVVCCALVAIGNVSVHRSTAAAVVWTGPNLTFSKSGLQNPELPAHQDRLTDNVWLTRGGAGSGGIFNIKVEDIYSTSGSPTDTQWATSVISENFGKTIAAANHANLAFDNWAEAFGGPGPALLGNILSLPAVMHLVSDDIYLNIQFTAFNSSGLVTYERSTFVPTTPQPTGDYNNDGFVDAADYTVWRNTLGQNADPPGSGADGNVSGEIDAGDYLFWKEHYGDVITPRSGGLAVVPEPASIVMAFAGLLPLFVRRR